MSCLAKAVVSILIVGLVAKKRLYQQTKTVFCVITTFYLDKLTTRVRLNSLGLYISVVNPATMD